MSSFELNKIVGALLLAVLVVMVIGKVGDNLVRVHGDGGHGGDAVVTAQAPAAKKQEILEPIVPLLASADAGAGEKVFAKCKACHDASKDGKNKIGPNLWSVVNGKKAGAEGFSYSDALKDLGGTWTYADLNAFLAKPREYAKGTKMSFVGLSKVKDRANVVAWLRQQADTPAPLPTEAEIAAAQKKMEEARSAAAAPAEGAAKTADGAAKTADAPAPAAAPADEPIADRLASASVDKGKRVFAKCRACHDAAKDGKNKIGPKLWEVVNSEPASTEGFNYSSAMKDLKGKKWTYQALDEFLESPKTYAKGTKMTFAGIKKASDRADVILYLRSLSDNPAPLK